MITEYRGFLADEDRVQAYRQAIFETVRPGDTVVDLGTGLGTYAFFAAQAGARKVYAIESAPIIQVAQQLCKLNRMERKVVFIPSPSSDASLPEKADVIVTEIFGALFMDDGLGETLLDVRNRWLKPGGTFIPSSVELFITPVEMPETYREIDFWGEKEEAAFGLNFLPTREMALNCLYYPKVKRECFLSEPASLHRMDLNQDGKFSLDHEAEFTMEHPGTLHGLAGWFDLQLSKTMRLTNSPFTVGGPSWVTAFFPLEQPETIFKGDVIRIQMRTISAGENLFWSWDVEVIKKSCGLEMARSVFHQSTFKSFPISRESLLRHSLDFAPSLSEFGEVALFILSQCDGLKTIKQLAEEVCRRFPKRFPSIEKAAQKVSSVISGHAR